MSAQTGRRPTSPTDPRRGAEQATAWLGKLAPNWPSTSQKSENLDALDGVAGP
jgi:hypothetical protein